MSGHTATLATYAVFIGLLADKAMCTVAQKHKPIGLRHDAQKLIVPGFMICTCPPPILLYLYVQVYRFFSFWNLYRIKVTKFPVRFHLAMLKSNKVNFPYFYIR